MGKEHFGRNVTHDGNSQSCGGAGPWGEGYEKTGGVE